MKRFGGITAVDGTTFHLREHEILGLIGPNGAGKTTIFDLISGFLVPDEGTITFAGENITSLQPDKRAWRGLGRSFQDARLVPSLTVAENIAIGLERFIDVRDPLASALGLPGIVRAEEDVAYSVADLVELMNLGSYRDKFVRELSTGTRRIVDLAMCIAHDPKVLLLDEPSSGIAQRETEALGPLLHRIQREAGCALLDHRTRHAPHHEHLRSDDRPRARPSDRGGHARGGDERPGRRLVVPRWRHGHHQPLGRRAGPGRSDVHVRPPHATPQRGDGGRGQRQHVAGRKRRMRMHRRGLGAVAAVAMAAGSALCLAPGASAATVDGSGWWWRPNTTAAPIEVPPRADVSVDQLLVEGTAEGATAVAAVRFKLSEGETSPILTLTATQDSAVPATAVVLACRVGSSWLPAQGGKWEQKPIPDCATSVQGIQSEGGKVTFALTPLQSGSNVEVVLVPGNNPTAGNDYAKGSSFTLKFPKPTTADLKTTTGDSSGFSGTGGSFAAPDASSFGADSGSTGDSSSLPSGGSTFDSGSAAPSGGSTFDSPGPSFSASPAFSQPSTFTPAEATAAPATAALPAREQITATGVTPVAAAPVSNTSAPKKGRTLGIVVLLLGAALGFWAYTGNSLLGGGPKPVPVPVVPVGEPIVGGLGRFARTRTGPPPSLS